MKKAVPETASILDQSVADSPVANLSQLSHSREAHPFIDKKDAFSPDSDFPDSVSDASVIPEDEQDIPEEDQDIPEDELDSPEDDSPEDDEMDQEPDEKESALRAPDSSAPEAAGISDSSAASAQPRLHLFQPGVSGNPSGRPRRTKEEKDALESIKSLAPDAVEKLKSLLNSSKVSASVKVKICEIILDRTYGKSESAVKLTSVAQSVEQSRDYVLSLVEKVREGG